MGFLLFSLEHSLVGFTKINETSCSSHLFERHRCVRIHKISQAILFHTESLGKEDIPTFIAGCAGVHTPENRDGDHRPHLSPSIDDPTLPFESLTHETSTSFPSSRLPSVLIYALKPWRSLTQAPVIINPPSALRTTSFSFSTWECSRVYACLFYLIESHYAPSFHSLLFLLSLFFACVVASREGREGGGSGVDESMDGVK